MIAVTDGSVEFEISMGKWFLNKDKRNNRLPVTYTCYVHCGILLG